MQWTGTNSQAIQDWIGTKHFVFSPKSKKMTRLWVASEKTWLFLDKNDWIIKDNNGYQLISAALFASGSYTPAN